MLLQDLHHRSFPVLPKLQLPFPVDAEESAQYLRRKIQHIPVGLNVILRINGEQFRSVRKRLDLRLGLCQFHTAGGTAQRHHPVSRADGLKAIENPVKAEHPVISLQFQHIHRPVGLAHLKGPHRDSFVSPVRQPQVVGQFHFRVLQSVPVDIQEQADPHLSCIHSPKFDLRITATLSRNIATAFHDILLREQILRSGSSCYLSCPVILPGVPLHRLQERFAHRVHRTPLLPFSGIKKAPIISD